MGGLAPELGGACFVQGPPVLGFVHCVRVQNNRFSSFWTDFFFSEFTFAVATKVPLRQKINIFVKKRENRGDSCAGSG